MSLDGLRAWIGEVERQLGARTRVFLVLVAIAIGGAGTGIYLAAEAENDQVSRDDLQALESTLQARIATLEASAPEEAGATGAAGTAALELQVKQLQAKVEALEAEKKPSPASGGAESKDEK